MTPTEQKKILDSIACAVHGWPDDETRRTYLPTQLPGMIRRLRQELANAQSELALCKQGRPVA